MTAPAHVHAFEPWPGRMALYRCACGVSGIRFAGAVVAHKEPLELPQEPTARPSEDGEPLVADLDYTHGLVPGARRAPRREGAE